MRLQQGNSMDQFDGSVLNPVCASQLTSQLSAARLWEVLLLMCPSSVLQLSSRLPIEVVNPATHFCDVCADVLQRVARQEPNNLFPAAAAAQQCVSQRAALCVPPKNPQYACTPCWAALRTCRPRTRLTCLCTADSGCAKGYLRKKSSKPLTCSWRAPPPRPRS